MTANDEFGEVEPINDEFGEVEPISKSGGEFGEIEPIEKPHKVERSKAELMELKWQAETGQRGGAGRYAFANLTPFAGSDFEQSQKEKLSRMKDFADGKPHLEKRVVDGREVTPEQAAQGRGMVYDPEERRDALDDMMGAEAEYLTGSQAGSLRRGDGESRKDYEARLKELVGGKFKESLAAQEEARQKLENTDETLTDKIVVGGMPSIRYTGELAVGGAAMKGVQGGAKLGFNLLTKAGLKKLVTKEGAKQFGKVAAQKVAVDSAKALPATIAQTEQGARELARDEYGLDESGNPVLVSKGDDGDVRGKAFRNAFTENLLENLVGEITRPVAGRVFESIGRHGGKIGRVANRVYQQYNRITDVTGFGDILFEELPEENVQYIFSDILGWGKKDSEYKGVYEELMNAFGRKKVKDPETGEERWEGNPLTGEGQFTASGQWNTVLAMLMQMGGQAAVAGGKVAIDRIDAKRNLGSELEKTGLTKEQIGKMSLNQRVAFANAWNAMRDNPEALQEALSKAGGYLGKMADELTAQTTINLSKDISAYKDESGNPIAPHRFEVNVGEDGKPVFQRSIRTDLITGETSERNDMFDEKAGVAVSDNGDGTFEVRDEVHPSRTFHTDSFEEAIRHADLYALTNQKQHLDNLKKAEYAQLLTEGENAKFKRPAEFAEHVGDVYRAIAQGISENGDFHGITDVSRVFQTDENGEVTQPPTLKVGNDSQGFTCPDGTIVGILDNIGTAEEMNKLLAHESGHAAGRGDPEARKEMLARISPDTEYGKIFSWMQGENAKLPEGRRLSDEKLREEAFSRWLEQRGHNPSIGQRITHALFGKVGKLNDADLEVIASRIERESANAEGGVEFIPADINVESTPVVGEEQTETTQTGGNDETGNGADEAQPQPEEGAAGQQGQEEPEVARPGEAEPSRGEAPREGVVEERGENAAPQKPVSERNIVEKLTDQAPVQELPVAEVVNDDSRIPNFKEGANPETGEVEPLTGEPYDLVSNPIVVMEFNDGKKVVVTGRHRLAMYKRSGRKTIAARVIREADGWTVDDAKAIDAIGNIIDEKGSVKDYVNYFNNAKPTRAEAKAGGFLDRPKGQRAFGIFEGATEATKSVIDWNGTGGDGLISVDQAGIIAEAAPKDANKRNGAVQRILVQKALAGLRGKKLGILARSLAEEAKTRKETPNVGGEMQLDLFTSEDDQKLLTLEEKRSDYRVKKAEEYGRIAEVLRTALAKGGKLDLNADYAKELGITDPNDRKQLAAARDKAVERANYWETAVSLDEADKSAMDADINAAAEAGAKKREAAKAKVEAIKAKREGKVVVSKNATTTPATKAEKQTATGDAADKTKAAAEKHVVSYGNGQKGTLADMIKSGMATLYPAKGLTIFDKGAHVVTIGMEQFKPTVDELPYLAKLQQERDAQETREKPPVSAPAKTEATTPAKPKKPAEAKEETSSAKPAATGAADMFEDKAVYDKSKAALDEIDFMDPAFAPDRKEDRPFDVLRPDGKIVTLATARSRKQAQAFVDKQTGIDPRFPQGGTVYERGTAKNAIMSRNGSLGNGAIKEASRRYPDATRDSGADFTRAVGAGVTHARTKREALAALQAVNREGVAAGRGVPGLSGVVAGKSQRAVQDGWRYFSDGTVVVPIFDGTPGKAKKAFLDILKANAAFGGCKVTGYAEDAKGDLYAVLKGPKVESLPEPIFEDKAAFLKEHGFVEDMNSQFGRGQWSKGSGYDRLWVAEGELRLANTPDGKQVALHPDVATTDFVNFSDPAFDPERFGRLVTGVGKLVDALAEGGHKDFKSLATFIYKEDPAKYERAKPVLQDIWNAVARARKLERISDSDAEKVFASIEKPSNAPVSPAAPEAAPKPPPANKLASTRISDAAREIINEINSLSIQGKALSRKRLTEIVENQLGGKVADGDIEAKQVTDILELSVNRQMKASWFAPTGNAEAALLTIRNIRDYLALLPTQTTRSIEQDKMQQFSTPPHEAFAAAWVANIGENDVMLEPSAGIGGIAVFGANAGAKVVLNELSPRRAEILEQLGIGKPHEFNAENLYAYLEPMIKSGEVKRPTVVVMNPPFSNSQRTSKKNTHIGADHVEQALKLLAPGGRLVAIVGNGMAHDKPAFKAWWDRIGSEYTVRANVGVNGQEYAKYGTTFDNNIIVIDKVAPNGSIAPIYGTISSLDELPAMLEGVRNDRPSITERDSDGKLAATQQGGNGGAVANGRPARPVETRTPGASGGEGSGRGARSAGQRGGRPVRPQGRADAGLGTQNDNVPDGRGIQRGESEGTGRGDAAGLADGRDTSGRVQPAGYGDNSQGLAVQSVEQTREVGDGTFSEYKPSKLRIPGMKPHPTALVESSAMASVPPQNPTYSPKIPKKLIEDGTLSEAQIEQVVYAGQAHEKKIGSGERRGYFIGDGTGVGKGREISGIILDNFNNGRKKAVWISQKPGLSNDAKRDLTPFGLSDELFTMEAKNLKNLGSRSHGIAFTTYASLSKDHERIDERGNIIAAKQGKETRMQALVKWLGRDFDGVIVFDEAHTAGNAVPVQGKRGYTKPSNAALAVIDLQTALPNARILYVSATGATEVSNLAYATRLGLWGKGTAFPDRSSFIQQVSNGGISVMEIVARDMKAMGMYMARTLSYEGIENERVTHELSPDQVKQYNLLADTWQMVMSEIEGALISSNGIHGKANGNAMSAFWGAHQRFFNQTLTAMQMPSVLKRARELWESGNSPVFQIVSTNEAAQKRAMQNSTEAGGEVDVENLDLSPRDILIGFVENSFPTTQYVEVETDGGGTKWVPLTDPNGNPIPDPAAVERKERLIGRLQRMKMGEAPLEMILNEFGHENVAEITGRSARREMVRNEDGEMEMRMVKRTKNNVRQEADEFNDGKRTVLVFSGAGNTGFSFHADRKFKNQRRRVQFMIEAGYNAAAAIQGLGRTHRANESSHPMYELCSTNLPGHKRFMSTIARRLAQLGSLTSGDRSSAGSGVFSEADNLENQYAANAVLKLFEEMYHDDPEKFNRICSEMGFTKPRINPDTGAREYVNTLIDEDGNFDGAEKLDIPHFLNRILAMKIDAQNELFDAFSKKMADMIERAKDAGTFDPGLEKLKGEKIEIKNRTRLWEDENKIGTTDIVEVGVSRKARKIDYDRARMRLEYSAADGATPTVYVHNASGEVLMMVETKATKTMADGSVVNVYKQLKPSGETGYTTETAVGKNYTPLFADGEKRWTEAYDAVPELVEQSQYFADGTLLPIWDRLGATNPRFYKVAPTGGAETQPFLGMSIDADRVNDILMRFGKAVGAVEVTPDVILNRIMKDGKKVELQNGWTLKRVKVLGDSRIEIDGVDEEDEIKRLAGEGYAYAEKIGYLRAFVKPTSENIAAFLKDYPAIPDKGGLSTVTGSMEDLSGDKYKEPLDRIYEQMSTAPNDAAFRPVEEEAKRLLMRLSNEQLRDVFAEYRNLDTDKASAPRSIRRIVLHELAARKALPMAFRIEADHFARDEGGRDEVDFSDPAFDPERMAEPPTPEEDKKLYGFTNDEIALAMKAAGMEPPKHVVKSDETLMRQADTLLSNREYMRKLAHAVFQKARATRDYENVALGIYADQTASVLNDAKSAYDEMAADIAKLPAETDAETVDDLKKQLKLLGLELSRAKKDFHEASVAKIQGASEQGRALRSNRIVVDALDYSYAGLRGTIEKALGGREIPKEMDEEIGRLAENFKNLDEKQRKLAVERLKAFSQKIVDDMKRGDKTRRMTPRGAGNELKRVMKNYNDALTQIEVHADEAGGTLIGLADQLYPSWGKWLRAIGEYHCYMNPDIDEQGVIDAIRRDISPYLDDGIDEETVRDILTGFGQNYRQSRYDSQRKMNDLKAQSLAKRQRDYMLENGKLPPQTGMVRDEPSAETRAARKEVQELKKDIDQQEGGPRALKGALDAAKTRIRNQIADLERAILRGEQIERSKRTIVEDAELKMLRSQRDELRKTYDDMFGSKSTLTDEQRRARAEKSLEKVLERAIERLGRARAGDFSSNRTADRVTSERIEELRNAVMETNAEIRALKKAAFPEGTPEEQAKRNARRMQAREKAILRVQDMILSGDVRPNVRKAPPMPPEMQKQYDELGKQLKRAHKKVAEMRLEAANATTPKFWRKTTEYFRFATSAQRALRATMDFSAVLRQAARITLAHPVLGAKSFGKAWEAAKSDANLTAVNDEIMSDPTIQEAVSKYGLHLREVDAENARDVEMFHGMERNRVKVFGKEFGITDIPFFGEFMLKSERHYITYLNAASAELYSSIVNDRTRFPAGATPWQKKMVSDMINVWNGSAALSKERRQALQKAWINDIFWAPGLAISRIQSAVGYDVWHPLVAKGVKNANGGFDEVSAGERAALAKLGLSEHLKSSVAMLAIGALLKWMFSDDDDWYNFKQADWWEKMMLLASPKVGNTTIDLTGGEASFNRLVHQIATQSKRTGSGRVQKFGGYGAPTTMGVVGRYLQGKTSPWLSELTALWDGRDYVGEEYTIGKAVYGALVPLTFEDIKDQFVQNGVGMSLVTAPLSLLGAGGSTYDRKPYENAVSRFKEAYDAGTLAKPEDAAKAMAAIKQVTTAENAYRKAVAQLDDADAKGADTAESRKRLETVAQRVDEMKSNAMELIRASR